MRARPHNINARVSDAELENFHKNCWFFLKDFPASKSDRLRFLLDYLTRKRQDLEFQAYVDREVSDGPPVDQDGMLQVI